MCGRSCLHAFVCVCVVLEQDPGLTLRNQNQKRFYCQIQELQTIEVTDHRATGRRAAGRRAAGRGAAGRGAAGRGAAGRRAAQRSGSGGRFVTDDTISLLQSAAERAVCPHCGPVGSDNTLTSAGSERMGNEWRGML